MRPHPGGGWHEVPGGDRGTDDFSSLPKACGCNIRQVCTHLPVAANQISSAAVSFHRIAVPLP